MPKAAMREKESMSSVDSGVSESDVLSMFDKDGDLRDEPQSVEESAEGQENEEEQEEETDPNAEQEDEEEEEESPDEDEESDEEEEDEPEAELSWDKVPPEHKAAYDASQKEVAKLRKDYGKIQSKLHEVSQSRREEDQTLEQLRSDAQIANQWTSILEQHPELQAQIVDLVKKAQNPDAGIPEHLREDPAVQFMLEQNRRLENQLRQLGEQTKPLNEWKSEQARAANKTKLDGIIGEAETKFKALFNKDMTEDDKTAVLKYMVENQYYGNPKNGHKGAGINAVLEVFGHQYEKALSAKEASRLREKAAKFGGRNKSVNPRRATSAPRIASGDDAIRQALRDQGQDI